MEIKRVLING